VLHGQLHQLAHSLGKGRVNRAVCLVGLLEVTGCAGSLGSGRVSRVCTVCGWQCFAMAEVQGPMPPTPAV
jgi:hypothetical protein